ncbi:hypothetical protein VTI74DRAFT_7997 [Chaetomium olivicolor]
MELQSICGPPEIYHADIEILATTRAAYSGLRGVLLILANSPRRPSTVTSKGNISIHSSRGRRLRRHLPPSRSTDTTIQSPSSPEDPDQSSKMGVLGVTNACIHLQNAARARLGLTSVPNTKYNLRLALAMHRAGLLASVTRGGPRPPPPEALLATETEPVTFENVATRRLWLGLKYWNNEPVIRSVQPVSKPSRLVTATLPELSKVARGFPVGQLKGLSLGETLFLSTDRGVLEVREALERKVGGLVLCRVK